MTVSHDDLVRQEADDALARRLRALHLDPPDTLVPRVLASARSMRPRRRRGRTVILSLAAACVLVAANLGASYISPRYAQVLADAPGAGELTGPILAQAGLGVTGAQALDLSDTASGYTVHVFGVSADAVRTTVFVKILGSDGRAVPDGTELNDVTLTDQFGTVYHLAPAFGMPVLNFEPLTGPAATLGARLTLRAASISMGPGSAAPQAPGDRPSGKAPDWTTPIVNGPWSLSFSVTSSGGTDLQLPSTVHVGDTNYTFNVLRVSSSILEARWTVTGGAVERQWEAGNSASRDDSELQRAQIETAYARLIAPGGSVVDPVFGSGHGVMQSGTETAFVLDTWWPITAHGNYTITVAGDGGASATRTITVP